MNVWSEIKKMEGKTLYTLDWNKPFDIMSVSSNKVFLWIHSTEKERTIHWNEIEESWNHLEEHKMLTRTEIQRLYSERNPAYVASILANLPGITHDIRPITLYLKKQSREKKTSQLFI
jgi:hypothetical protein